MGSVSLGGNHRPGELCVEWQSLSQFAAFNCNSTANHAHWRQKHCFQQVLWPVHSTSRWNMLYTCREWGHWTENKGGQSAHNQVTLNNGLLDKLLLTASHTQKSLCDEAMVYYTVTLHSFVIKPVLKRQKGKRAEIWWQLKSILIVWCMSTIIASLSNTLNMFYVSCRW